MKLMAIFICFQELNNAADIVGARIEMLEIKNKYMPVLRRNVGHIHVSVKSFSF